MTIGIYDGHAFLIKKISIDWQEHMYAVIAKHASHKLVAFNATLKPVRKEEQLSITQTSRQVPQTAYERERERSIAKTKFRWLERASKMSRTHIHPANSR